jgi:hypothetical protein
VVPWRVWGLGLRVCSSEEEETRGREAQDIFAIAIAVFSVEFPSLLGGNFSRRDSTDSVVIVESGAGDFWIDQSEFLLVGDWIWRLGFSLFVVLGECDCLFRRIGERERESEWVCVLKNFYFLGVYFLEIWVVCVRACVFFLSFFCFGGLRVPCCRNLRVG